MQMAMIGLGRMGANMARRLRRGGHDVVVHDVSPDAVALMQAEGFGGAASLEALATMLAKPRTAWVMVPAGAATEAVVAALGEVFESGDLIVDGGNSHFNDDVRRSAKLAERGVMFADAGTSGGVWGLERGYCLMVGGSAEAFTRLEPILRTLAPGRGDIAPASEAAGTEAAGYLHCGPEGAGHFVKMVHNGIEYGLMQAYAEGFDLLAHAGRSSSGGPAYELDLAAITELWRRGSVVTSWLLDLSAQALAKDAALEAYSGHVADSGEGRWTIDAAVDRAVPANVLAAALFARFRSRREASFSDRVLSAMRHGFGGHVEPPRKG